MGASHGPVCVRAFRQAMWNMEHAEAAVLDCPRERRRRRLVVHVLFFCASMFFNDVEGVLWVENYKNVNNHCIIDRLTLASEI